MIMRLLVDKLRASDSSQEKKEYVAGCSTNQNKAWLSTVVLQEGLNYSAGIGISTTNTQ